VTMLTTGSISANLSINNPGAKTNGEEMDRSAFLKLFTTQLQNQNPLDPVKNEAFVAQLAQFSQLEATTKMADSLDTMASASQADRLLQGAALIGKRVSAPDGTAELVAGANISSIISIPNGADKVSIDVYDAAGNKISTRAMGRQVPGDVNISWDGTNNLGERQDPGRYKIVASVTSMGQVTQMPITTPNTVTSVTYSAAQNDLILELQDGSTVALSQVKSAYQ
jgi:flagellar basal-body rod modification protein FlgD